MNKNTNFPELVPHLSNLRKAMRLTRSQLAEKSGLNISLITRYENGTLCPHDENAIVLASILGVSVDDLIGKYNTKLWSCVLCNDAIWIDSFGRKSWKQYLNFMRSAMENLDHPSEREMNPFVDAAVL